MAYFLEKVMEVPPMTSIDFDVTNRLILLQMQHETEYYIDMYSTDFELYAKIKVRKLYVRDSTKVAYRPVPTSQASKHSVQVSSTQLNIYTHQDYFLKLSFGLLKKQPIIQFEWINGNIIIIFTMMKIYMKKILWPKGKNLPPMIDQEFELVIQQSFMDLQFITKDLLLLKLQNTYSIGKIDLQKFIITLTQLSFSSSLQAFGYYFKPQIPLLCPGDLNNNIKQQLNNCFPETDESCVAKQQSQGIYYENIATNSQAIEGEKYIVFFLNLELQQVSGFSLTQNKILIDFKIPSAKYQRIFIVESFLYCYDSKSSMLICYDLLNWNGQLSGIVKEQSSSLQQNSSAQYKLVPCFVQRVAHHPNFNLIVRAETPSKLNEDESTAFSQSDQSSILVRFPFILINQCQLQFLQLDGRRLLCDLGQPIQLLDMYKHICVSVNRSLVFVDPLLDQFGQFLNSSDEVVLHIFAILLNRTYEVRTLVDQNQSDYNVTPSFQVSELQTPLYIRSNEDPHSSCMTTNSQTTALTTVLVQKYSANQQILYQGKNLQFSNTFLFLIQQLIDIIFQISDIKRRKSCTLQFMIACCTYGLFLNYQQLLQLTTGFAQYDIMQLVRQKVIPISLVNLEYFQQKAIELHDHDLKVLVCRICMQNDMCSEITQFLVKFQSV